MKNLFVFLLSFHSIGLFAQIDFTANDVVPIYNGKYAFGSNMGYYPGWNNFDLANISAGNEAEGVRGVGVQSLRPAIFEHTMEYYGYDLLVPTFEHYKNLGMTDHTVFIGYPSAEHRDSTFFCEDRPTVVFKNMYQPIWDDGTDGTPINEENYYANYVYKMASTYKDYVTFWEVWNEPDFDLVGNSEQPPGWGNSWWDYDPDPCEYALHAPIEYYVRLLRISYEVIKFVDPDAFVAVGGIGYPSFLDAIMRNTDNPVGGMVTEEFPLGGGAYFDVLSYHSYPHIDGSLREWDNAIEGFRHFRHSDPAAKAVADKRGRFDVVLDEYGYDDVTYPKKYFIITETNVPRVQVDEFFGSEDGQRNFIVKSIVQCQKQDIKQVYMYNLAEGATTDANDNEFHFMGFYAPLEGTNRYNQEEVMAGIAHRTLSQQLYGKTYDAERTEALQLPNDVDGAAFVDDSLRYSYVLWAKTNTDRSESTLAFYTFPDEIDISKLVKYEWHASDSGLNSSVVSRDQPLKGDPYIFSETEEVVVDPETPLIDKFTLEVVPNPSFGETTFYFAHKWEAGEVTMDVYNSYGQFVFGLLDKEQMGPGQYAIELDETIPSGVYYCHLKVNKRYLVRKFVHFND